MAWALWQLNTKENKMQELKKKIDEQAELMTKMREEETDEAMREYYLGKIVAYAEVQGLIDAI